MEHTSVSISSNDSGSLVGWTTWNPEIMWTILLTAMQTENAVFKYGVIPEMPGLAYQLLGRQTMVRLWPLLGVLRLLFQIQHIGVTALPYGANRGAALRILCVVGQVIHPCGTCSQWTMDTQPYMGNGYPALNG